MRSILARLSRRDACGFSAFVLPSVSLDAFYILLPIAVQT